MVRASPPGDIGFEPASRRVKSVRDELDGQASVHPVAVHLVALPVDVRPGARQSVRLEQGEKPLLEKAQDHVRAERPTQLGRTRFAGVARDARLDVPGRHTVTHPCLVTRSGELVGLRRRREIQQDAGHGRDGDRVKRRGVERVQRADPVDHDPRADAMCCRRHGHLRSGCLAAHDGQQMGPRPVAEVRAAAGGENGRAIRPLRRPIGMAEGVDADVLAPQPAVGDPALDPVAVDAGVQQLRGRDATALTIRDLSKRGS